MLDKAAEDQSAYRVPCEEDPGGGPAAIAGPARVLSLSRWRVDKSAARVFVGRSSSLLGPPPDVRTTEDEVELRPRPGGETNSYDLGLAPVRDLP